MLKKDVHIGSIILKVFQKRKMTVAQFAREIGCHRTRIYPIFQNKSIDVDLLIRISKVLNYNFLFEYIKEEYISSLEDFTIHTELDFSALWKILMKLQSKFKILIYLFCNLDILFVRFF